MKLNYDNLPILQSDYLDLLKKNIINNMDLRKSIFVKDKKLILAKIQYLSFQKGLTKIEIAKIINYLVDNERILEIIYDYKGVCNRDIFIKVINVFWELTSIETKAGEVIIFVKAKDILQDPIVRSENTNIQLFYNNIGIFTNIVGSSQLYTNIIFLFLPAGVKLTIIYN